MAESLFAGSRLDPHASGSNHPLSAIAIGARQARVETQWRHH